MTDKRPKKVKVTVKDAATTKPASEAAADAPDGAHATHTNPYAVIAEPAFKGHAASREDLVRRIMDDPRMHDHRDGFESCIQCGICTSGCPAARFTEYVPREIARRALDGDPTLLEDDTVWYCFYCYTCQSRCPRHNSVAVINQVIRSMQVESGRGVKHVEMFAAWGEQFYDKGMGGTPHVFFADIAEAWGDRWKAFIADRDRMRDEMGLGGMFPAEEAVKEVQTIMEETGFFGRLKSLGAWKDKEPAKRP